MEDLVGGLGPDERTWVAVVSVQVGFDGTFELDGGAVSAATDLPLREGGEEAFDLVDPRRRGRREVHMKARMPGQPTAYGRSLVRAVVVHHQMYVESCWHIRVDRTQEFQELAAAMAAMQFSDDFAGRDIECGKQCGGAVAQVVVRAELSQQSAVAGLRGER